MPGQVVVGNVRQPVPEGYTAVYVGRRSSYRAEYGEDYSALGNPFTMPKYTREEAVKEYGRLVRPVYASPEIRRPFMFLGMRVRGGERLALLCFCAPQLCHAEVIRDLLLEWYS